MTESILLPLTLFKLKTCFTTVQNSVIFFFHNLIRPPQTTGVCSQTTTHIAVQLQADSHIPSSAQLSNPLHKQKGNNRKQQAHYLLYPSYGTKIEGFHHPRHEIQISVQISEIPETELRVCVGERGEERRGEESVCE